MMMRLSFKTQFKIEFLLPFTGSRKVLGIMPANIGAFLRVNLSFNVLSIVGA